MRRRNIPIPYELAIQLAHLLGAQAETPADWFPKAQHFLVPDGPGLALVSIDENAATWIWDGDEDRWIRVHNF